MTEEEMNAKIAEIQAANSAEIHKRNEENKSLRDRLTKFSPKALATYEALKARFGVEEVDETFLDTLQKTSAESLSIGEQLKQTQLQLEREKQEKKSLNEKLSSQTFNLRAKDRDAKVLTGLGSIGVMAGALADSIKLVASDASWDEVTNEWTFAGKSLDVFLQDFKKSHMYLIGNPAQPGTGNSREPNGGSSGANFLSEADYMKMTPEQQRTKEVRDLVAKSVDSWT